MAEPLGTQPVLTTARLLIVDDERAIRESMGEVLRQHGYRVDAAASGPEALQRLSAAAYDLMLLDMLMPGMHGVEVMRRARALQRDLLIIVLTAHATVDSAIAAVKADVVDYMLKPCSAGDLKAAVARALQERARQLRRQRMLDLVGEAMNLLSDADGPDEPAGPIGPGNPIEAQAAPLPAGTLHVGPVILDQQKRYVTLMHDPHNPIELTENEVAVLETLMKQPDQVLSLDQLAGTALGYRGMDKWTVESVVRSCIFRLRQKIERQPDGPQLICTVRGRGYYFKASNGRR